MFRLQRIGAAASVALLLSMVIVPMSAFAHERRTIGNGKYDVVVGWDVEPAYADQKNGASIRISTAGSNPAEPVVGAEKSLTVDIRQGATTRNFPLRSVFGQPGYYVADILPTREGDYQWTFKGTIGDQQVNDTFDTADGKFNKVESAAGLQFPQALPDLAQSAAAVQTAESDAQGARTLAYIAIAVGVLGLLAGLAAWAVRPRATSQATAGRTVAKSA